MLPQTEEHKLLSEMMTPPKSGGCANGCIINYHSMEHLPGDPGAVAEDGISSHMSSRTTVRVPLVGQRPPNHLSASYYPQYLCTCCLGRVGKWVGLFVCVYLCVSMCVYVCVSCICVHVHVFVCVWCTHTWGGWDTVGLCNFV